MPARRPNYWDYIRVEELLALQSGIAASEAELGDDEVRFIVIHQIDELWFKLVLRELTSVRDMLHRVPVPESALASAARALRRVALIFRLAHQHFELMETMPTQAYLEFRDKLAPASGFQSAQMREIEILLGLDEADRVPFGHERSYRDALRGDGGSPSPAEVRVDRRLADLPSVKAAIYVWLARAPIDGSRPDDPGDGAAVDRFIAAFLDGHRRANAVHRQGVVAHQALTDEDVARLERRYAAEIADAEAYFRADDVTDPDQRQRTRRLRAAIQFIESNRRLALLSWPGEIIDAAIEAEQAMLVFRQRHARMVERVIGRRVGTGGSDGVDYLDRTALSYRVFKEVWMARTLLLARSHCPPAQNPEIYGLRME